MPRSRQTQAASRETVSLSPELVRAVSNNPSLMEATVDCLQGLTAESRNNEITNVPYNAVRIAGLMPHGADYWADINVDHPRREDYVFHVEFNYIHDYGLGMLNDMGAIYLRKFLKLVSLYFDLSIFNLT